MNTVYISVLGEEFAAPCAAGNEARLTDLAAALDARVRAASAAAGEADARLALVIAALSLLDDAQQAGAALARAHAEVDRLRDALAASDADFAEFVSTTEGRFAAACARATALAARV